MLLLHVTRYFPVLHPPTRGFRVSTHLPFYVPSSYLLRDFPLSGSEMKTLMSRDAVSIVVGCLPYRWLPKWVTELCLDSSLPSMRDNDDVSLFGCWDKDDHSDCYCSNYLFWIVYCINGPRWDWGLFHNITHNLSEFSLSVVYRRLWWYLFPFGLTKEVWVFIFRNEAYFSYWGYCSE